MYKILSGRITWCFSNQSKYHHFEKTDMVERALHLDKVLLSHFFFCWKTYTVYLNHTFDTRHTRQICKSVSAIFLDAMCRYLNFKGLSLSIQCNYFRVRNTDYFLINFSKNRGWHLSFYGTTFISRDRMCPNVSLVTYFSSAMTFS